MTFPPEVERWRSLVERYFPPELVDKALYVIQYESGGNPGAVGDGGAARGLFQIQDSRNFPDRPDAGYLDNAENNIRYAAEQLGAAGGNWGAWGEGTSYNGQPFGALGNHPYPGDNGSLNGRAQTAGGTSMPVPDLSERTNQYYLDLAEYYNLERQLMGGTDGYTQAPPDDPRWARFDELEIELLKFEEDRDRMGQDWDRQFDVIGAENDARRFDADQAAAKWARENTLRAQAEGATANDLAQQAEDQAAAYDNFAAWKGSNHFESGALAVPSTNLPGKDELYGRNFERLSQQLPEIPDYSLARPPAPAAPGTGTGVSSRPERQPIPGAATGPGHQDSSFGAGRSRGGSWGAEQPSSMIDIGGILDRAGVNRPRFNPLGVGGSASITPSSGTRPSAVSGVPIIGSLIDRLRRNRFGAF